MKISFLLFKQRLLALAICCFLFAARGAAQSGVLVTYYDGSQQGYSIATSGKLYFENGNLQIVSTNASTAVSIPVTVIRKITFSSSILPLRMVDFTISNEKSRITLSWKTENEINTSHFIIERSVDGTNYETIGQVTSLNNGTGGNYNFADQFPKMGVNYYRLKQVDVDGKYDYSKVLTVKRTTSDITVTILPNPATDYFRIISTTTERLNVKIYSSIGKLMVSNIYAPGEQISVRKLTPGMYTVIVNNKTYKLVRH